ncbi:hypothetical protein LEP3755_52560 [Leptolyngbya sp. NIES-3755]|nr:hypothetical protein LEP3755_52560 [Leptolyngbya sp. NIES-3755]
MPIGKRSSTHLEKAQNRLSAIKSINSSLDLGKGLSVQAYASLVEKTRNRIEIYNSTLSMLNADRVAMEEAEKELKELNERMLLGIALEFGKDSPEYEIAGGIRKSKRKRPARKKTTQEEQAALN